VPAASSSILDPKPPPLGWLEPLIVEAMATAKEVTRLHDFINSLLAKVIAYFDTNMAHKDRHLSNVGYFHDNVRLPESGRGHPDLIDMSNDSEHATLAEMLSKLNGKGDGTC
jgi:hypothetical protein